MPKHPEPLLNRLLSQLEFIYQDIELTTSLDDIAAQLLNEMRLTNDIEAPVPHKNHWSEQDIILITYGDSILPEQTEQMASSAIKALQPTPLKTLKQFIDANLSEVINSVHILPFFPYSSDDGFSVIDYSSVNESLGDWDDIQQISKRYNLMSDLVINHCSRRSMWFENFRLGEGKGHDFFFTASPEDDLSMVTRPRISPLLSEVQTETGMQYVWCTFSHDQVDFDFRNPKVLMAFCNIIRQYLDAGVKIFRFDAIAFLWKVVGTKCINLPQTHEMVRLLRTLIEHADPTAIIITETNIPNSQNLTYFGNANEAHAIYNFSLPPLLINTLLTGSCLYLKRWVMSMPPAQDGTTYFNFIASHDGVGLRPAEGLLSEQEINTLTDTIQAFGGKVSWRATEDGDKKAYEMNVSLFNALKGTVEGEDKYNLERFICAHAIMFALEGIPGIYIHSMLGTLNDHNKVKHTKQNRSINRHQWQNELLTQAINDQSKHHHKVLAGLKALLAIRIKQPAFHPNATQFTLHLGLQLFGFWRQSKDRKQSIFCISNITKQTQRLPVSELNLICTEEWYELISQTEVNDTMLSIELAPYQTVWISNIRP